MKKQNITFWAVLCAIPLISAFAQLAMYFVIYNSLKTLKPDTKRSLGKDIVLTLVTCGIFGLILPFLLMKETREGAQRVGVQTDDYTMPYAVVLLGGIGISIMTSLGMLPSFLGVFVSLATGPLCAYFFLTPFNKVAEAFNPSGNQLANP